MADIVLTLEDIENLVQGKEIIKGYANDQYGIDSSITIKFGQSLTNLIDSFRSVKHGN